jgi:hypothetical protein
VSYRRIIVQEDISAYKQIVKKMRNRKLEFPVLLQTVYPRIPYKGKWVKASKVMADIMAVIETDMNINWSNTNLKEGAKKALQPYLITVNSMQCIYIMNTVQGRPMYVSRLEMDSAYGEGGDPLISIPDFQAHWLQLTYDSSDRSYDATLGYGGECRPVKDWSTTDTPTTGVRLYGFNIRQFWIFKPDYDSDIYGIVNQSVVNII